MHLGSKPDLSTGFAYLKINVVITTCTSKVVLSNLLSLSEQAAFVPRQQLHTPTWLKTVVVQIPHPLAG